MAQKCRLCGRALEDFERGQGICLDCHTSRGPGDQPHQIGKPYFKPSWACEMDWVATELERRGALRIALALDRVSDRLERAFTSPYQVIDALKNSVDKEKDPAKKKVLREHLDKMRKDFGISPGVRG